MPEMVIKQEGGKKKAAKTRISNLGDIQTALRVPIEAIIRYFRQELDLPEEEGENQGEWAIPGKHELSDLQDLLDK